MSQLHFLAKNETGWNYKLPKICRRKLTSQSWSSVDSTHINKVYILNFNSDPFWSSVKNIVFVPGPWILRKTRLSEMDIAHRSSRLTQLRRKFLKIQTQYVDSDTTMVANEWLLHIERLDTLWPANTHDLRFSYRKGWPKTESNLQKVFAWYVPLYSQYPKIESTLPTLNLFAFKVLELFSGVVFHMDSALLCVIMRRLILPNMW